MTSVVLFISGDVGGARALVPVIEKISALGVSFAVADHGFLIKESRSGWPSLGVGDKDITSSVEAAFDKGMIGALVFTTSLVDIVPLRIAKSAKAHRIPVICILDNWMNYRKRLECDGDSVFYPDLYAVMDEVAAEEALADGIPKELIRVTGQPGLSSLSDEYARWTSDAITARRKDLGVHPGKRLIVFISEAVEAYQGSGPESESYRGYTEKIVLRKLCGYLQPYRDILQLGLVPHPAEDAEELRKNWESCRETLSGGLLQVDRGREAVFLADAVAGMASLLLYESWLLGKPVLSLQPGLRIPQLGFFGKLDGSFFASDTISQKEALDGWISSILAGTSGKGLRPEFEAHRLSPQRVCEIILGCMRRREHVLLEEKAS